MKKRIKHLSKSTVSVILTLCMLVSCVTVGLIATDAAQLTGERRVGAAASEDSSVAASAEDEVGTNGTMVSDGHVRLYINMGSVQNTQGTKWWYCTSDGGTAGDQNFAYFFYSAGEEPKPNAWSSCIQQFSEDIYYVTVPEGTWDTVILTRNSVTSGPSFGNGNLYNQTKDIPLQSDSNYISKFPIKDNGDYYTTEWGTNIVPADNTVTTSISPASTSKNAGESITYTDSYSSSVDWGYVNDSITYTVSPDSTVSGKTVTFDGDGTKTYTVTSTFATHLNGYTGITKNFTQTSSVYVTDNRTKLTAPTYTVTGNSNADAHAGTDKVVVSVSNYDECVETDSDATVVAYKSDGTVLGVADSTTHEIQIDASYVNNDAACYLKTVSSDITQYSSSINSSTFAISVTNYDYYIEGRFKTATACTGTPENEGGWNTSSTAIHFEYSCLNGYYVLDTGKSVAELSGKLKDGSENKKQYFHLGRTTNGENTAITEYGASSSNTELTSKDAENEFSVQTGDNNFLFNKSDSTDDSYVTLCYNPSTHKLWYTLAGLRYYVSSAGLTDSKKGFTDSIWASKDLSGKMNETTEGSGVYSITFSNQAMGWYRFKINGFNASTSLGSWGGAKATYSGDGYADVSTENSGNAKFRITKKSNVTITIDTNDNYAITVNVAAVGGGDEYEYYVVGMASDGTAGMFANVWADDYKYFDSADKMGGAGTSWAKTYTYFDGTYGTYSYKIAEVNTTTGTYWLYDNAGGSGPDLTVDVKDGAQSVTFTLDNNLVGATVSYVSSWQPYGPPDVLPYTSDYRVFYGTDSTFNSGRGLSDPVITNYNGSNDGKYYWYDLSDVIISGQKKQLFLYMTAETTIDDCSYQGHYHTNALMGDSSNTVTIGATVDTSATVNGTTYFTVETKDNTEIGSTTKYIAINSIKYDKLDTIGLIMRYTGSGSVQYRLYYKFKGSSGGGSDPTYNTVVDLYAKAACLRDSTYNRFANLAKTEVVSITTPDGIVHTSLNWLQDKTWSTHNNSYSSTYGYVHITGVPVGSKVKLRTTLSPNNEKFDSTRLFKNTHYLKAYSFNGYTYELHEKNDSGVYEEIWEAEAINAANMKSGNTVEITPIYYLKDNTYTKTFFIDGYEGVLSEKWGTMLAVYPYYKSSSNRANAFGGYPGQPMLYWGGKYQMEIPLTVDGTATGKEVKGLTMHNAYWDLLHRKLDTKCDDGHCQTYDYDDFYKIYKEKNADTIFFRYKYYPKNAYGNLAAGHDNYDDGYSYDNHSFQNDSLNTAAKCVSVGNGVEIVTDFYGNQIDAFGTILTDSQKSHYGEESGGTTVGQTKELLFVSTGYKNTYVGHYATIWAVYAPSDGFTKGEDTANKFIGYISSSMLYLNSIDRVKQYADGTNTGTGKMSWSSFKNTYNHLKEYYEGVPALISYEKELHNDTLDKADRSDGKWYYSTTGDRITANIKIQTTSATENVTLLGDHSWTDSPFSAPGAGNVNNTDTNGNSAYFTNTTPEYLYGQVTATNILADPSQQFNFRATSGNGWEFVGWVRYSDGKYYEIADKDGLGSSNISANDTYIARFKQAVKGSLVISHNTLTDSTYKGGGTKELKVEVMNGDTVVKTYPVKTDGSDIDVSSYINSNYRSYKLRITLTTVPDEDCWVATRTVSLGADSKYDSYRTDTSSASITPAAELSKGVTYTNVILIDISDVYDATNGVTALRYTTKLKKDAINYAYRIVYTYTSRFWGDQNYTVEGFIDELQAAKYFSGVKTTATLNKDFIIASTPYEKNFRQKIDWNYNSMTNNPAGEKQAEAVVINGTSKSNVYLMTAAVGSTNTVDDVVRAEFFLPYKYDETTKASTGLDLYDFEGNIITDSKEIAFDESSYESSTVKSRAGHLFDYSNENPDIPGPESTTEDYNLVVAAPYVYKGLGADDFIYEYRDSVTAYDGQFTYTTDTTIHVLESTDTVTLAQWYINPTSTEWFDGSTDASKSYAKIIGEGDNAKLYVQYSSTDEDNVTTYNYVEVSRTKVKVGIKQASLANLGVEKKYFTRWDIFTADGDYVSSSFAKSRAFNYSGYEDYMVIPVYESANQTYYTDNQGNSIPLSELVSTTITNLGDTRNRWNKGGLGYYKTGSEYSTGSNDCDNKGDKLMVDFALAYNNKGTKIDLEQQKVGLVIERLHKLDTTADNEGAPVAVTELGQAKAITDLSYYAKKYNTSGANEYCYNPEYTANYVKAKIQNTAVTANSSRPNLNAYFKTASKLDNFDRVQYTYTFTETNDNSDHTGQALYVYRATSYIYVNGEVTLSDPIYFTLYELASR